VWNKIVEFLIPMLSMVIMAWLKKSEANKEAKRKFIEFIDAVEGKVSVKLQDAHSAQIEELRGMIRQSQKGDDSSISPN